MTEEPDLRASERTWRLEKLNGANSKVAAVRGDSAPSNKRQYGWNARGTCGA